MTRNSKSDRDSMDKSEKSHFLGSNSCVINNRLG